MEVVSLNFHFYLGLGKVFPFKLFPSESESERKVAQSLSSVSNYSQPTLGANDIQA